MNKHISFYLETFKNNPEIKHKILYEHEDEIFFIQYNAHMIDKKTLNSTVIPSLLDSIKNKNYNLLKSPLIEIKQIEKNNEIEIENIIYSGEVLIYSVKEKILYSLNLSHLTLRSPSINSQEIVYGGSKDNLIESLEVNLSLIYKRIKTSLLINEEFVIGELSKTKISLLYLENEIDLNIIKEIKNRLKKIKTRAITSIGDLLAHLENKSKLVPLASYTPKVDLIEQSLLSGKAIIIIDGIPEAIVLPITLFNFGSLDDSINESVIVTFFSKIFSIIGIFISLFLLGLYTSIILYEPELIPYEILINAFNSFKGIALSSSLEIIIAYLFFQIFLHAGNKSLSGLSSSILVIGSLLIGQVAVSSGFISQITLIIVAISLFSCYIISNNISLNTSFMFLQLINFVSSLIFGLLGYLVSMIMIVIYLNSLESFSLPFLYPFTHLNLSKIKEALFSSNYFNKKEKNKWKKL